VVCGWEFLAIAAASSRASCGGLPCSAVKSSVATSVRTRARSLRGTGQSLGRPAAALSSAIRLATSTRIGGMSLL
jgi:hypothetical protein